MRSDDVTSHVSPIHYYNSWYHDRSDILDQNGWSPSLEMLLLVVGAVSLGKSVVFVDGHRQDYLDK